MHISTNPTLCKLTNRLNLEIITFGQACVNTEWFGNVISPVYSRLYYITDGNFMIQTPSDQVMSLSKGNWYLIPAGYSFSYKCDHSMEHFFFHIKLCDFDGTDLLRCCTKPVSLYSEGNIALLSDCVTSVKISNSMRLHNLVFDILVNLIEQHGINIRLDDYSPCIYRALVYIQQNLSMQLRIDEIAKNTFVSKSTLTKHFQKELKMSVNEYICSMIMAEAEQLLTSSNISIRELGLKFGYTDQLYFSRRFKEIFGKSPREYRKEYHP